MLTTRQCQRHEMGFPYRRSAAKNLRVRQCIQLTPVPKARYQKARHVSAGEGGRLEAESREGRNYPNTSSGLYSMPDFVTNALNSSS